MFDTIPTDIFHDYSPYFANKEGLEIGGPSTFFMPIGIYTLPNRLDNVIFSENTIWSQQKNRQEYTFHNKTCPGTVIIADVVDMHNIPDNSYDFVFASHILEHVVNPLKALKEISRVLRPNGVCILVLPQKENTFDHNRPTTQFSKLLTNYETDRDERYIDDYLPEIREFYDISLDPGAGTMEQFLERCTKQYENRALHVHVFDFNLIVDCLKFFNYEILDMQLIKLFNQIVVGRKLS
jgi:SAM-dependent methyltransferase